MLAGCTTAPAHQLSALPLDGRQWIPLQKSLPAHKGKDYVVELLPTGTSLPNWSEIITVQYFSTAVAARHKTSAAEFERSFLTAMQKDSPDLRWHVILENPGQMTFTWNTIHDAQLGDQEGLVRVTETTNGLYVLQYSTRGTMDSTKAQALLNDPQLASLSQGN